MITLAALSCYATVLINLSGEPWNAHDNKILARAKYVCATDYRHAPEFPCLKSLTKKPDLVYNAICGQQKE